MAISVRDLFDHEMTIRSRMRDLDDAIHGADPDDEDFERDPDQIKKAVKRLRRACDRFLLDIEDEEEDDE